MGCKCTPLKGGGAISSLWSWLQANKLAQRGSVGWGAFHGQSSALCQSPMCPHLHSPQWQQACTGQVGTGFSSRNGVGGGAGVPVRPSASAGIVVVATAIPIAQTQAGMWARRSRQSRRRAAQQDMAHPRRDMWTEGAPPLAGRLDLGSLMNTHVLVHAVQPRFGASRAELANPTRAALARPYWRLRPSWALGRAIEVSERRRHSEGIKLLCPGI